MRLAPLRLFALAAALPAVSPAAPEKIEQLDRFVVHAPPLPAIPLVPLLRIEFNHRLHTARFAAAAAVDGDFIYVVGGANSAGTRLREIERIDLRTGQSEPFAELVRGRRNHRAVVYDHRLYVLGGYAETNWPTDDPFESYVEIVDLATGRVTRGPTMPEARANFGCAVVAGKLYVIGGARAHHNAITNTNTVQVLDLATGQWSAGLPMPTPRMAAAAVVDGFIVVAGGYSGRRAVAEVEVFIPPEKLWRILPKLHAPTDAQSVGFLGHHLFLFGEHELVAYDLIPKQSVAYRFDYDAARDPATVIAGQRVYVIGGDRSKEEFNLEYYFPVARSAGPPEPNSAAAIHTQGSTPTDTEHDAIDTIQVFALRDVTSGPAKP